MHKQRRHFRIENFYRGMSFFIQRAASGKVCAETKRRAKNNVQKLFCEKVLHFIVFCDSLLLVVKCPRDIDKYLWRVSR